MEFARNQKILKYTGLAYTVCFVVTTLVFIFFPHILFRYINLISGSLFPNLPLATDSGKFWLSMTVSMMAGVTVCSFLLYIDVKKYFAMALPVVVMKFTSSAMGLGFFIAGILLPETNWNTLANIIIFITDFPLGLFMMILYLKARDQ